MEGVHYAVLKPPLLYKLGEMDLGINIVGVIA